MRVNSPRDHADVAAWLRLSLVPGLGNDGARKLLAALGLPEAIFAASLSSLVQLVRPAQAEAVLTVPPKFTAQWAKTLAWLEGRSAGDAAQGALDRKPVDDSDQGSDVSAVRVSRRVVTLADPTYPTALLQMEDPPLLLYVMGVGDFAAMPMERCIAMVGSRNPTPQGAGNARQFAKALASSGLTVISGLAQGVDGEAHEGALEAVAGPGNPPLTVAVVGTGLDRVYPGRHLDLAHRIAAKGLLVSEYALGTPPLAFNFPRRNRLIAGLSRATLVVEAALKSGSLITARLASEQGRDVLAIPGSIHSAQSRGCHALIKQGAKLVESAQDVLEEFGSVSAIKHVAKTTVDTGNTAKSETENSLLMALGFDPVGLDALQARTGTPTAMLQADLLTLELEGHVVRLPGGLFQRQGVA